MLYNSVLAGETIRHGAYVCLRLAVGADTTNLADIAAAGLLHADALVHVASPRAEPVRDFCAEVVLILFTG